MSLKKNKKGVEALPLKYIIIALVAALVVGIALQFTGTLKGGILSTGEKLNETLATQTACELDFEEPVIGDITITVNGTNYYSIEADISDDCGIESAVAYVKNGETTKHTVTLTLDSGTKKDGSWTGEVDSDADDYDVLIWALDESSNGNTNTRLEEGS